MEAEQILTGVANYGFPICISWYLLVRMEGKLDKLSLNIDNLTVSVKSKVVCSQTFPCCIMVAQ